MNSVKISVPNVDNGHLTVTEYNVKESSQTRIYPFGLMESTYHYQPMENSDCVILRFCVEKYHNHSIRFLNEDFVNRHGIEYSKKVHNYTFTVRWSYDKNGSLIIKPKMSANFVKDYGKEGLLDAQPNLLNFVMRQFHNRM